MQKFIYRPPIEGPKILYQDQDILVVNKPSGLLSNPGRAAETQDCALTRVQKSNKNAILIHRLDCETSGILIFALNKAAERHLKIQFQERQVNKTYLALVDACPNVHQGRIELPLTADKNQIPLQKVDIKQGKSAITDYQVLWTDGRTSLLKLHPLTGRTHQLRVHLKSLGHTILGDNFYASDTIKNAKKRLCLHASEIKFTHPRSNKLMHFLCPADF
ncbi:RluA family pseudouridine synthase [Gayadomonas joobiniege]|uniref:RluA family pseudouridine synthase n=1 Tax=Gayadomonas joobiniege TaxID=1234606 RepID=UPI00037D665A|nr:RluA family pseudouridine synthase [Gayadomonas joobiniege]